MTTRTLTEFDRHLIEEAGVIFGALAADQLREALISGTERPLDPEESAKLFAALDGTCLATGRKQLSADTAMRRSGENQIPLPLTDAEQRRYRGFFPNFREGAA